VVKVFFFAVKL